MALSSGCFSDMRGGDRLVKSWRLDLEVEVHELGDKTSSWDILSKRDV